MAYTWTTGEVITAEKLNATSDGEFTIVHITEDEHGDFAVDKTYAEIAEAYEAYDTALVAIGFGNLYPNFSSITLNGEDAFVFYSIVFDEEVDGVTLTKTGVSISESDVVGAYYESVLVEKISK